MALALKQVDYELVPIDIFAEDGPGEEYLELHPFGRIPALQHGDFDLFETDAIVNYIGSAFPGPPLVCEEPRQRARMHQLMRIADNYAYPTLVWKCYVPAEKGFEPDEDVKRQAEKILDVMEDLAAEPWLTGPQITLADLYIWPILTYFRLTEFGRDSAAKRDRLTAWVKRMSQHPVSVATRFDAEIESD